MIPDQLRNLPSAIQCLDIFRDLDTSTASRLCANGKIISLQSKKTFQKEYQVVNSFYTVIEGRVFLSCISEKGRKVIVETLEKGDFFGDFEMFGDKAEERECLFIEPFPKSTVVLYEFNKHEFFRVVSENPTLAVRLALDFAKRISRLDEKIERMALYKLEDRVLMELREFELKKIEGLQQEKNDYKITHEKLAELTGSVREAVSRTLVKLRRMGKIFEGNNDIVSVERK